MSGRHIDVPERPSESDLFLLRPQRCDRFDAKRVSQRQCDAGQTPTSSAMIARAISCRESVEVSNRIGRSA